jgi:hypothetical protein
VSPNPGKWLGDPYPVKELWITSFTSGGVLVTAAGTFGDLTNPIAGLPVLASSVPFATGEYVMFPSVSSDARNLLVQNALKAMLPGIKSDLSLPNTLFELKDMRTLAKSHRRIQSALDGLNRLGGIWKEVFKARTAKKSLKAIVKGVADSYLQSSFNLLPLLNDLGALRGSLVNLRRDLDGLRQRANVPQRRKYRQTVAYMFPNSPNGLVSGTLPDNWVVTAASAGRAVRYDECMFSATIEYRYSLPSLSDFDFEVSALLDRLGFNYNPKIIWDALPWSFVIDWFLGVGRFLDQYKVRSLEPTVHIHEFCYSLHVARQITTSLSMGGYAGPVFSMSEEAYERKVGLDMAEVKAHFE